MALDLSALEEKPVVLPDGGDAVAGKPLMLKLADIEPDPKQPRKTFTPEKMAEMVASIKESGVMAPISVRPNPDQPGRWIINFGERRWRASKEAGKADVPAFINEALGDYDQVVENLQREDLKPMELALFIDGKMKDGEKKAAIARKLGVDASVVTNHLALIDPPECIEAAYSSGRCTSAKTLYDLRSLHTKFPEAVEVWCKQASEITRTTVSALAGDLKDKKTPPKGDAASPGKALDASKDSDRASGGQGGGDGEGAATGKPRQAPASRDDDIPPLGDGEPDRDLGELTSWPRGKAVSDPDLMKKPLLLVEYDGRAAAVLLNRKPTTAGLIRIRYEDGGGDAEVDAGALKVNLLTEAEK